MQLSTISENAWREFQEKHPDALTRTRHRNSWQNKRLEELQALEIVWLETDGNHGRV